MMYWLLDSLENSQIISPEHSLWNRVLIYIYIIVNTGCHPTVPFVDVKPVLFKNVHRQFNTPQEFLQTLASNEGDEDEDED